MNKYIIQIVFLSLLFLKVTSAQYRFNCKCEGCLNIVDLHTEDICKNSKESGYWRYNTNNGTCYVGQVFGTYEFSTYCHSNVGFRSICKLFTV